MDALILTAVVQAQTALGLPPGLLQAIIEVESGGNPYAIRHEPGYRWLVDISNDRPYRGDPMSIPAPRGCSRPTEAIGQQTSWGPMQIMGATARELGFKGWFPELCGPKGVEIGARYLARLAKRYQGRWDDAIEAYNAGRAGTLQGQAYREKVKRHWNT